VKIKIKKLRVRKKQIFSKLSLIAFTKAFNLATSINLLTHDAKGTPLFLI
jgi:hypothetical protein